MDDGLAGRDRDTKGRFGEAATDTEDGVRPLEKIWNSARNAVATRSKGQWVRLIETTLARQTGADGGGKQFGKPAQLHISSRPVNALPRVDDGSLRCDE